VISKHLKKRSEIKKHLVTRHLVCAKMMGKFTRNRPDVEFVCILICSRNRREELENLVNNLKEMSTNRLFEIVVVEETDDPVPIEGTRYIPHPVANKGFPYARNLALQNASGEIVVFVDDDCTIHQGWLDNLLKPFSDELVVGVQGGVTVPSNTNAIGWAESILGFPGGGISRVVLAEGEIKETKEISTLNCAYRKWVLDKVGGFDERLKFGGEDYLLAKEACTFGKCVFAPNALVSHDARGNLLKIFRWFHRRGRAEISLAQSGWKRKEFLSYWLRSSLFVKLLLLTFLGFITSYVFLLIIAAFVTYYFFHVFNYQSFYKKSNAPILSLMILPLVKTIIDLGNDFGRFRGLFASE